MIDASTSSDAALWMLTRSQSEEKSVRSCTSKKRDALLTCEYGDRCASKRAYKLCD